jgi:hypothetical protein
MSLNILLEILHPIEATLEFYLHITDVFGVYLMHSQGTQFISCPSLLVLLVGGRTNISVLLVVDLQSP